jgi:hypothetical protein
VIRSALEVIDRKVHVRQALQEGERKNKHLNNGAVKNDRAFSLENKNCEGS